MIEDGDRIAVGLSGGKDSWALFWLLWERCSRVPVEYTLLPIHIDLGFENGPRQAIDTYMGRMGLNVHIEATQIGLTAHSDENRENPCFLCARKRRQRLFEIAHSMGCNKLALGHTKDDLIETLFINMLYAGTMSTMLPLQPFFNGRMTVIRPLAFTNETRLDTLAEQRQWPVVPNPCPSAGRSKRAEIKTMLESLYRKNRKIKGNIFRAMRHVNLDYLP
ncbi:MAG: tRNA 2-thiocytidine(32) synthetase TtcA [Desulfatitalea sp.]|nr:tRNA 2-thiocytidine(32) synthetase TtcA [Desulfatitalea sp.]NNJ99744.1 tRNA 2-thiocytidine(32) synthetase TtcA [Desulfatitalea sp.]